MCNGIQNAGVVLYLCNSKQLWFWVYSARPRRSTTVSQGSKARGSATAVNDERPPGCLGCITESHVRALFVLNRRQKSLPMMPTSSMQNSASSLGYQSGRFRAHYSETNSLSLLRVLWGWSPASATTFLSAWFFKRESLWGVGVSSGWATPPEQKPPVTKEGTEDSTEQGSSWVPMRSNLHYLADEVSIISPNNVSMILDKYN